MLAEPVHGRWAGFERPAAQVHIGLVGALTSLAPVTRHTGGYQVLPGMWPPLIAWDDVVQGEMAHFTAAILAGVLVAPQNFMFRERDAGPGALDHIAEPDDRGYFKFGRAAAHNATAVQNRLSLAGQHQRQGAFRVTDVQWFKVHIQNEHRLIQNTVFTHNASSIHEDIEERQLR